MTYQVVTTGYASADYPALVSALPQPDSTAFVERRLTQWWPAFGGCGALVARWLSAQGISAHAITWVGDDDLGRRYVDRLERSDVGVGGVVVSPGGRTGTSHLYYARTGEALTFFAESGTIRDEATDAQLELAGSADWLCLTVAPSGVNWALLEAAGPDTRVSWVVKADPVSFPADLVRQILVRCSLVTFSRGERPFLREMTGREQPLELLQAEAVAVETHGREGVRLFTAEGERFLPVDPVDIEDATGAGDVFHAGMVAHMLLTSTNPLPAANAGIAAARDFLLDGSWRSM